MFEFFANIFGYALNFIYNISLLCVHILSLVSNFAFIISYKLNFKILFVKLSVEFLAIFFVAILYFIIL